MRIVAAVRILHVSDCYLPRLGGIETQVQHLAQRQVAAGHEVDVLTATPKARHDRTAHEVLDGVSVLRASADLPYELPLHPRAGAQVAAALRRAGHGGRSYDVAHVHTGVVSQFAYAALPVLVRARTPVVITVHSMWGPARPAFALADRLIHWSRWPVVFSAVSEVAAAPLRRVAGRGADVRVIPNGIDVAEWRLDPSELTPRSAADEVVLAAVMRLAPRKRGLALLRTLRAVRALVPRETRLRAVIVGEGPQRAAMERYLRRAAMTGWVELPGRWDREAIRALYRRADVFVSAANLESFGIAALEARTAGVPVLAKASTGAGEFLTDGVDGVLVDDDAALTAALAALVVDPAGRAAMAAQARSTPPPTTWEQVLRRCDEAYAAARSRVAASGQIPGQAPE